MEQDGLKGGDRVAGRVLHARYFRDVIKEGKKTKERSEVVCPASCWRIATW